MSKLKTTVSDDRRSLLKSFLLHVPLGYLVWWKKDIRLSISLHVFSNALVRIFLLMGVLAL